MGAPPDLRAARLATALRANLRRRKGAPAPEAPAEAPNGAPQPASDRRGRVNDGAGEG